MEVLGYLSAVLIGVALGLIGGGGSILTVPVLVYLLNIPPVEATSYSLFIVGVSALIGSAGYMRSKLMSYRTFIVFGIPSLVGVYLSRRFVLPSIPDHVFSLGGIDVDKGAFIMILFSILMIAASVSMIRKPKVIKKEDYESVQQYRDLLIFMEGLIVGGLTGMVGAGGGFLIIPALVVLAKLPMKMAVGTSLLIIAVKSLVGFFSDLRVDVGIDWKFLAIFTGIAIIGIIAGTYLSRYITGNKLRPVFGWFVLIMAVVIVAQETLKS